MAQIFIQNLELILLTVTVFLGSFVGTLVMRFLAKRYGWMVMPREDRWHKKRTALHGGVGFYPAFIGGAIWILIRKFDFAWSDWRSIKVIPDEVVLTSAILIGSLVMFIFGLWDDIKQFRPVSKLLCQLAAASIFIYIGGIFPLTGIRVMDILITYFWFVGIVNAVNMLDNMDGLSSGVVILAGTTVVILAVQAHSSIFSNALAMPLGLIFIAALVGFWCYNRPPASIFMGDSGSLFIGYVLAALAIPGPLNGYMGIRTNGTILGPALVLMIPVMILAIPIFDTILVTITRTWRSQKPTQGGQDHSSHRLVGLGLSECKTVWLLYSFAAFGGGIAILIQRFTYLSLPLFGLFVLVLILTGVYLGRVKVQIAEPENIPAVWTPLVSNILYKRHAAEILLDLVLIVICFCGAYFLRNDGNIPQPMVEVMINSLPLVIACCLLACFLAGIYQNQWRLISVSDLPRYIIAVFGGAVLSLAVVTLITRFGAGHSRSAYIIFGILFFLTIVGSRLSFRVFDSLLHRGRVGNPLECKKPVLVYGAGKAGKVLFEEAMFNPQMREWSIVGFVDDDQNRVGHKLCGLPVKKGAEWVSQSWDRQPEIWVSSRFIPDCRAQQMAEQWQGKVEVHRLKLEMEPILNGKI